jgi:RNA polymerase sigma-70 factor (ECF subfamily)
MPPRDTGSLTLERFRRYLEVLAEVQIDPRLRGKIDASGVVQQTLLEAHRALAQTEGWGEEQRLAWLRRILGNNLTDEIRKLTTQARDAHRECSLDAALEQSSARLEAWLIADQSSPSLHAQRHEQALRVADALSQLPDAQREALILQHWHGWPLADIGRHLGRSPAAVAGLLHRGLERLRAILQEKDG